jgi:hypothetical protein
MRDDPCKDPIDTIAVPMANDDHLWYKEVDFDHWGCIVRNATEWVSKNVGLKDGTRAKLNPNFTICFPDHRGYAKPRNGKILVQGIHESNFLSVVISKNASRSSKSRILESSLAKWTTNNLDIHESGLGRQRKRAYAHEHLGTDFEEVAKRIELAASMPEDYLRLKELNPQRLIIDHLTPPKEIDGVKEKKRVFTRRPTRRDHSISIVIAGLSAKAPDARHGESTSACENLVGTYAKGTNIFVVHTIVYKLYLDSEE